MRAVDYDAIRTGLIAMVRDALGYDQNHVIMAEPETPNAPRPSLPYATLKVTSLSLRRGYDELRDDPDAPLDAQTRQMMLIGARSCQVSFQSYGTSHEEAATDMATLQAHLMSPYARSRLFAAGLATATVGDCLDVSELLDTAYEGRCALTCTFNLTAALMIAVDTVGTVPIDGLVLDAEPDVAVQLLVQGG